MDFKYWIQGLLMFFFVGVSLLMTFFILLQEGKGGGLAALGGTKAAAVEGVTNPIRRATAYLAGMFFMLAIVIGWINRPTPDAFQPEVAKTPSANITPTIPGVQPAGPAVVPTIDAPKDAPKADAPKDAPKADAPKDAPKADAPKADAPKADAPKEEPKAAEPAKADAPKEAPKADAPKTDAPKTETK